MKRPTARQSRFLARRLSPGLRSRRADTRETAGESVVTPVHRNIRVAMQATVTSVGARVKVAPNLVTPNL